VRRCEELFGPARGQQIHQLVEESIGEACPCLSGKGCPIAPEQRLPVDLVIRIA
jgi:hypothetical protein